MAIARNAIKSLQLISHGFDSSLSAAGLIFMCLKDKPDSANAVMF